MICEDCKHTIPGDEAVWCGECVENALSAARSAAVRAFAEWVASQCQDQLVWIKDDETEDDTHTTFRSEYPPSVTTRTIAEAAARFLARKEPTE